MFAQHARLLIATIWVGSLWTVGYLVAPTLFATLPDSALAGTIAGRLFRVEAWVSVSCAVLLFALIRWGDDHASRKALLWLIGGMLLCTLIGYFGLQPSMAALRETASATGGIMSPEAKSRFGMLHGIASGFYLAQSLLGAGLMLKIR